MAAIPLHIRALQPEHSLVELVAQRMAAPLDEVIGAHRSEARYPHSWLVQRGCFLGVSNGLTCRV